MAQPTIEPKRKNAKGTRRRAWLIDHAALIGDQLTRFVDPDIQWFLVSLDDFTKTVDAGWLTDDFTSIMRGTVDAELLAQRLFALDCIKMVIQTLCANEVFHPIVLSRCHRLVHERMCDDLNDFWNDSWMRFGHIYFVVSQQPGCILDSFCRVLFHTYSDKLCEAVSLLNSPVRRKLPII